MKITMRSRFVTSLAVLSCLAAGCVAARSSGPAADHEADVAVGTAAALTSTAIPVLQYEQSPQYLRTMDLYAGEFMYMGIYPNQSYTRTRCLNDGCTQRVGERGQYQLTRTRAGTMYVRFLGPTTPGTTTAPLLDRYAYELAGSTVWLRRAGTTGWFPMQDAHGLWSETLCDSTHGSWTDDDASADGMFCVCGANRVWTAEDGCTAVHR